MNKNKKFSKKEKVVAMVQAIILVLSIVAISYLIQQSLPLVSAQVKGLSTSPISTSSSDVYGTPGLGYRGVTEEITGEITEEAAIKSGTGITFKSIVTNFAWAFSIYTIINFGLQLLGMDPSLAGRIGTDASIGYFLGSFLADLGVELGLIQPTSWLVSLVNLPLLGPLSGLGLIGIGFGILISILTAKDTEYRVVQFTCNLWDAPSGGNDCTKCNNGILPCTEYRCKSLGQSCELVNKGTNQELCVWVNRDDVTPPVIQAWDEALTTSYKYIPDNAISPPDRGVKIVPKNNVNGCVAPFTRLKLGVTLDEPAKCKISSKRVNNFNAMENIFFSGAASFYNHSYQLSLPSNASLAAENITVPTGEDFSLYVRCEDKNGNSNVANFVFKFCVDERDTDEPRIESTSIINGMPIAFNQTDVNLSVYVNEPAECKWSRTDLGYDDMENSMVCKTRALQMNAQGLYECKTTLTGLRDRVENVFYFRCKDQPWLAGTDKENDRFVNQQSYKFTLKGTEPLYISSAKPNETTIKDSTDIIKVKLEVETSAGYDAGKALCYYKGYGTGESFNEFFTTNSYKHSQDLFLPEGDYAYDIRCVDLGGNADTTTLNFNVETDTLAPIVVRAYHEGQNLKIITNENASCVYNYDTNIKCEYNFNQGLNMSRGTTNKQIHFTTWDLNKIFYIKCSDEFGNQPLPYECSITIKPFEIKK